MDDFTEPCELCWESVPFGTLEECEVCECHFCVKCGAPETSEDSPRCKDCD